MSWRSAAGALLVLGMVGGAAVAAGAGGAVPEGDVAGTDGGDRERVASWRASCPRVTNDLQRDDSVAAVALPTGDDAAQQGRLSLARVGRDPVRTTEIGDVVALMPKGSGPAVATASGGLAPTAAMALAGIDEAEEGRGLATAMCPEAASLVWFAGVGAAPGQRDVVLLSNPGDSAAVADVSFYGPDGPIIIAGSDGVVVQPGDSAQLPIDALIPGVEYASLLVTTRVGAISAMVATEQISGLIPQGAAYLPPSEEPSREPVIPGVLLGGVDRTLVVTSPDGDATVEVLGLTAGEPAPWPDAERIPLVGGGTVGVELGPPPEGFAGTVLLRSNAPITAAIRQTAVEVPAPARPGRTPASLAAPMADSAWTSSARTGSASVALPVSSADTGVTVAVAGFRAPVTLEVVLLSTGREPVVIETLDLGVQEATAVELDLPGRDATSVLQVRRAAGSGDFTAAVAEVGSQADGPWLSTWPGQRIGGRVTIPAVQRTGVLLP